VQNEPMLSLFALLLGR